MIIPDICHIHRILCSRCPLIHLFWRTPQTSLLKRVGLPGPSFISLAIWDKGWEVANRLSHVCRWLHPCLVGVLLVQHLRSPGPTLSWSDGNSSRWSCTSPLQPILCVGYVTNVLGRVPLIPLFLLLRSWGAEQEGKQHKRGQGCGCRTSLVWRVCQCLRLRSGEWLWCNKGPGGARRSNPTWTKGGATLRRRRLNEARK